MTTQEFIEYIQRHLNTVQSKTPKAGSSIAETRAFLKAAKAETPYQNLVKAIAKCITAFYIKTAYEAFHAINDDSSTESTNPLHRRCGMSTTSYGPHLVGCTELVKKALETLQWLESEFPAQRKFPAPGGPIQTV